jgi:hypothetical protein
LAAAGFTQKISRKQKIISYFRRIKQMKMIKKILLLSIVVLLSVPTIAQDGPVQIIEEKVANRMMFHALNETDIDYDILISIEGTNFRQSTSKPRLMRIPATSRVDNVARIMLIRDKEPQFSYKVEVNDSLSRRSLRKQFTLVKVKPPKPITVYVGVNCQSCDSILKPLEKSKYQFTRHNLTEKPEIASQLKMAIPGLDVIETPIFSLGGVIFPEVKNYEELLEKMNKE